MFITENNMPRVPQNMRKKGIGMLHAGMCTVEIARQLGTSARTIRRLRERFNTAGETKDRLRRRRRHIIHVQDRYIVTPHLRDQFLTASVAAQNTPCIHNNQISCQTVLNRLGKREIRAHVPYKGQVLTVVSGFVHIFAG